MGPITDADWAPAAWLVGSQLRATFQLPLAATAVVRARAYVAAAGCHPLEVNGRRPSPDLRGVCPWTVLRKRVLYQTHDITPLVRQGDNVVGILSNRLDARDGLSTPLVRAILRVETAGATMPLLFYTTGGNSSVAGTWMQRLSWATMTAAGHPQWLRGWQMHMNWTAEEAGWSSPGSFRPGQQWSPAVSQPFTATSPAQQMPWASVIRHVPPINTRKLTSNNSHVSWLYKFSRNLVGMIEIKPLANATTGSQVMLVHGEWLEEKDTTGLQRCEMETCGSGAVPVVSGGLQSVVHTLRRNNSASLSSVFAYMGFQYIKVVAAHDSSFSGGLDALVALEIHPDVTSTGQLTFGGDGVAGSLSEHGAEVLSGVQSMLLGSQLSNLAAYIPTSCPTTEKQGWLGDALFASEESMYNFDLEAIYQSWLTTVEDNQGPSGDVPYVSPGSTPGPESCNDISWTSAFPRIASYVTTYYGSLRAAERHWPSMSKYVDNLIDHVANGSHSVATCDQVSNDSYRLVNDCSAWW